MANDDPGRGFRIQIWIINLLFYLLRIYIELKQVSGKIKKMQFVCIFSYSIIFWN